MNDAVWTLDWSWWKLAAGALALAAAATLSVWGTRRERGGRWMRTLEVLRVAIVALLVLTLLRPERVRSVRRVEKPMVAVLCDASGSMATRDAFTNAGPAVARSAWLEAGKERRFWAPLETAYDVRVTDFAAPPTNAPPDADPGTDLNAALEAAMREPGRLRAVLLLSDGDWNQGSSPVAAATRLRLRGVPVYGALAGHDRHLPDLELQSVLAPAYGLVDERLALPFTVQSRMPREVRTSIALEGPEGVVARKDLVIPAMAQVQGLLAFQPRVEGESPFAVRIPVQEGETDPSNNAREFRIALRREKLKVLLVESEPRWEFRYLRNALLRDPGIDAYALLLHPGLGAAGGYRYLPAFPATRQDLATYDVIFLGDIGVGNQQLTEEHARQIRGLVEQQGSGLVFLPGANGFQATLKGTELEPLLPVELDPAHAAGSGLNIESKLVLTTRGREHWLTMLASDPEANEAVWRTLPGFFWHAPVVRAKPGSEVLAVHGEARNEFGRLPLLTTRPAGNGKVLFMGTDSAWRWRRGIEDTYHYRFWGQVVRWMAHQRHLAHAEGIRFFYAPEMPNTGDRVFLHATVFDPSGLPLDRASVEAVVRAPSGAEQRIALAPEEGGWGTYAGTFVPREGGSHAVRVECRETQREARATVEIRKPRTERTGRPARAEVLGELASITGGRSVPGDGLDRLVEEIRLLPEAEPEEQRFRLWCHPAWGGLIVFLLGLYWSGRKWTGRI